jgi:uncharacterized protein (TIGR03066 family)
MLVNALRLVLGCAILLVATAARAEDKPKDLLVGKWEGKEKLGEQEVKAVVEFTKDGKVKLTMSGGGMDVTLNGTYKVLDDKTLETSFEFMGQTMTDKSSFKVTKDSLEITNKQGKVTKLTRGK